MKQILLCLSCALFCCSCSKYQSYISRVNNDVSGIYILEYALWECGDLDLDGGDLTEVSNDILYGLRGLAIISELCNTDGASVNAVTPAQKESMISVKIPLQNIRYDSSEGIDISYAVTPEIKFKYSVNKSGNIVISDDVDYSSVYRMSDGTDNLHCMNVGNAKITLLSGGFLTVGLVMSYYDYITRDIVTGPVELRYRRL